MVGWHVDGRDTPPTRLATRPVLFSPLQNSSELFRTLQNSADCRGRGDRRDTALGQTLGCFCKPKLCHGDVIVEYLDQTS